MNGGGLTAVTPVHAPVIAAILKETGPESWSAGAVTQIVELPGTFGFVATAADDEPVGMVLCRAAADEAEVLTIGVRPAWRGSGWGGRLLAAALEQAAARAARRMFLEVAEDNAAARRLYARAGFADVGRRPGYYRRPDGPPADALILQCGLAEEPVTPCG